MKFDVSVQSYKKPESLVYTLLTLHDYCADYIDTVYINDDRSGNSIENIYLNENVIKKLSPWKIKLRISEKKAGVYFFTKQMFYRRPINLLWYVYFKFKGRKPSVVNEMDIRYHWAITSTDKKYMLLIHDDVKFTGDFIKIYEQYLDDKIAIVGDLGQCWRCPHKNICSPGNILSGKYPSSKWPLTYGKSLSDYKQKRSCRINEWCAIINIDVARKFAKDKNLLIGASEDLGDTGAYWFDYIVKKGYKFTDPIIAEGLSRADYYIHWWQGYTGHSVWEDQGNGKKKYESDMIRDVILEEYNINLPS